MNNLKHRLFSGEAYCRLCLRFSDEAILFSTNYFVRFINDFFNINVSETEHMCALCRRRIHNSQQLLSDTRTADVLLRTLLHSDNDQLTPNPSEISEWEKNIAQTRRYNITNVYNIAIPFVTEINATIRKNETEESKNDELVIKEEIEAYFDDVNTVDDVHGSNVANEELKLESIPLASLLQSVAGIANKQRKKKRKKKEKNELNFDKIVQKNNKESNDNIKLVNLSEREQTEERNAKTKMLSYIRSRYKCETCIRHFPTQQLLRKHRMKHSDEHGIYACNVCGLRYRTEWCVRRHEQSSHIQRYECTVCGFRSESRAAIDKHYFETHVEDDSKTAIETFLNYSYTTSRTKLESDNSGVLILRLSEEQRLDWLARRKQEKAYTDAVYRCERCVKGFIVPEAYQAHLMKHKESYGPALCDVCGQYTKSASSLASHRLLHYRRYACARCPYNACIRKPVLEHVAAKHSETPRDVSNLKCQHCDKAFSKLSYLRKHVRRHDAPRSNAQCAQCGKWLHNNDSLRIHMLQHAGVVKDSHKRYACPDCPLRFRSAWQLNGHKSSHTDSRPFYCAPCDIAFKTYTGIRAHQRRKHDNTDKYRFECDYCRKTFPAKSDLAMHIGAVHLKTEVSKCSHCDKSFINGSRMRMHVRRVHQKGDRRKDKICHICGKAFHTGRLLEDHIRTHTGERPYECSLCPAKFTQSGAAHTHHRLVHLKVDRNVKPRQENISIHSNDDVTYMKNSGLIQVSEYWNV